MRRLRREMRAAQAAVGVKEVHEAVLRAELRQSETVESYAARLAGAARDSNALDVEVCRAVLMCVWIGRQRERERGRDTSPSSELDSFS